MIFYLLIMPYKIYEFNSVNLSMPMLVPLWIMLY
jgi:hypothetical protein